MAVQEVLLRFFPLVIVGSFRSSMDNLANTLKMMTVTGHISLGSNCSSEKVFTKQFGLKEIKDMPKVDGTVALKYLIEGMVNRSGLIYPIG